MTVWIRHVATRLFFALALAALGFPWPVSAARLVEPDGANVLLLGRFDLRDVQHPSMQWALSTVSLRFTGTSAGVRLKEQKNKWSGGYGHYLAIVDGATNKAIVIEASATNDYVIAQGLAAGEHSLEFVRLAGAWQCASRFEGALLDDDARLLPPPPRPQRRIEIYGDSITEGSYMEGQPKKLNPYLTYGAVAGRQLGAEVRLHAKGGIGLIKGYALPQTLPGIFDRVLPGDPKAPKFAFQTWLPHVVIVNIGQNDKWTLAKDTSADDIVAAYKKFIQTLRGHRPRATLVCALGSMDTTEAGSPWPGYVTRAVEELQRETGDQRLHTLFFPYIGRKGHPHPDEQAVMAAQLVAFLRALGDDLWK